MAKKETTPEPFWNELVGVFFSFCRKEFNEVPTFDGSAPRDMLSIIKALKKRAETKNIAWTLDEATKRFQTFLEHANKDKFLHENFLLLNLNRFKDKVFFNAAKNVKVEQPKQNKNQSHTNIPLDQSVYDNMQ